MDSPTSQQYQQMRLSETEHNLLKSVFKDNSELLLLVRNAFLGFRLTKDEEKVLQTFTPPLHKVLRKIFLPELEKDIPIGQSVDLWMTLNAEGEVEVIIDARQQLIDYLELGLKRLRDSETDIDLTVSSRKISPAFLIARKNYITHVELQLKVIQALVEKKDETEEERVIRQAKDSMK